MVTPLVEPLSLDEAYLDVTENAWGERLATPVARRIRQQIQEITGLTASAGVAPNKFLAKIASAWKKPNGLTVVSHARMESFLQELPVNALWGVGPVTARRLRAEGIVKLVDVRRIADDDLRRLVGKQADWLRRLSYGEDDRPVTPHRTPKSCGCEHTFPEDLRDLDTIREELELMARRAAGWLTTRTLYARTITIKVRYSDFTTITRSYSEAVPTRDGSTVAARALALLEKTDAGARPVRLLGVSVHNLTTTDQAPATPASPDTPLLWDAASPEAATMDILPHDLR